MKLSQPYYIESRNTNAHMDLNGIWEFCWTDEACNNIDALDFKYESRIPASVYYSLSEAGVLPHPYYGVNSKEYHWVDEKIWYYHKKFSLNETDMCQNAFLCFDGVSYYSRLWVNGNLIGEHEGMFAGPCCDIREYLNFNGENEILIEIKAANFENKDGYDPRRPETNPKEIVPWNIVRDTVTSTGDFIVIGIWNNVRLELLNKYHVSRPYMYTKNILSDSANIHFEVEISDGSVKELKPYYDYAALHNEFNFAYRNGFTGKTKDDAVTVEILISDNGNTVYQSIEEVPLTDFDNLDISKEYRETQFYKKEIEIKNPKLWQPNGLGEAFLYDVKICVSQDGTVFDVQNFKFGVRTFTVEYTPGNKYRTRWEKFLFTINGQTMFIKGMNWTPIDYLYDISPDRYEWCLNLVRNAGIQMIRVWSGGGMPESNVFYEICDRLGIMVWQDLFIANQCNTKNYPHDILENQIAYNLYRIRNHPSLVIMCGGNEFNPYVSDNAASMFIIQRNVYTLVPDRVFYYTTEDSGTAHIYHDMEPGWYRHFYKQLPFVGESGIHSFPNYNTIKKFINEREATTKLPDLSTPEFFNNYPEIINHFSEYVPGRVVRMTARMSQIVDMSDVCLSDLCEASQIQAYEYYQLMIQSMHENYPVCGGIMPWVFKRPWVTAAIQTVDGDDRPGLAYYAVMNSYKHINVCWCQNWTVLAPNEEVDLVVKVFNQDEEDLSDCMIKLTVFNPDMTVFREYSNKFNDVCDFGKLKLDAGFTNTCFLVCADISRDGKSLNRSVYFNKCTDILGDKELYSKHRSKPNENLYFKNGPWLKSFIKNAKQAEISANVIGTGIDGKYHFADVSVENISDVTAYPVILDLIDEEKRCFLSDNFFMLMPHESKTVRITCDNGETGKIKVGIWNGNSIVI